MNNIKGKDVTQLTLIFSLAYMVSYITRINFGAIISEIERVTQLERALLSMAVTGSFITYGVGQLVSGAIGDRLSPKKLVMWGFVCTSCMNALIPLFKNPYIMTAIWCLNGFAQSFMWPPLVRLMAELFSENDYKKAVTKVSWGSSFGTIIVYLLSPVLIYLFGWQSVFFVSAALGALMVFVWNKFTIDVSVKTDITEENPKIKPKEIFSPLIILIMMGIIFQGMLRDGITTWMPTFLAETYKMSSITSILSSVILPVFSIVSFGYANRIYMKKFKNPISCGALFFAIGTATALLLTIFKHVNASISIVLLALLTGSMHGVNLMLICMLPPFLSKEGHISTLSGVLNFCTYVGSALSTYGIATLSKSRGWNLVMLLWVVIAGLGTIMCLISQRVRKNN